LEVKEQKKTDENKREGLFINNSQREEQFQAAARVERGHPSHLIFNWSEHPF
jgi:hypothetical protein